MKPATKTFPFLLSFFLSITCCAQQANTWYFGYNCGLNFNTSPPSPLADGAMHVDEGCASISDSTGQIVFYTDGVTVYNKLHQVMTNGTGLTGHASSANSAIILPKPGSNTLYYIFTCGAADFNASDGYRYSIVDISLNGGLGAVTVKNVLLYSYCTERLTSIPNANGIDYWVVTKEWGNDVYRVYKLTCNGVDTNAVTSHAGLSLDTAMFLSEGVGVLKGSPNQHRLANTRPARDVWEVFDFNDTTGVISNPISIQAPEIDPYGLEFSPNSNLLYVTVSNSFSNGSIYQYRIDVYDPFIINLSRYKVNYASNDAADKKALQLAPDGKIYCPNAYENTLNIISSPDVQGIGCGYIIRGVLLIPYRECVYGLPAFNNKMLNNPAVNFTFILQPNCQAVNFSGTTTITSPVTWSWNFGDGTTGVGQNITHSFPLIGNNYNVVLTVSNPNVCGLSGTKMKKVILNRVPPTADFTFQTQCGNQSVSFTDASTIDSGYTVISWFWNFGDGFSSNSQNPIHTYSAYGQYQVMLTATSSDSCHSLDTIVKTITVSPKPISNFSSGAGCVNTPVPFTDQSTVAAGSIVSWYWNFGDGTISTMQNPSHNYATSGSFSVSLVTTGSNGCLSDTLRRTIVITPKPIANFNFSNGCTNTNINFTDNSTIASGMISSWYWNFGNGNISANQNGNTSYSSAGNFQVKHVAISNGGCLSDTVTKTISVQSKPLSNFGFITNCGSKIVTFMDSSVATNGAISTWYWNFGDGNSSTQQNPSHTYTNYGSYSVKLVTSTQNGCSSDTVTKQILVPARPSVDFILPPVCLLDAFAVFTNSTTIADNTSLSYHWNFGDFNAVPVGSDTSNATNPQYHYTAAAVYYVKLKAISTTGCADSITKAFTVNGAVPKADFRIISPNNLCSNAIVQIKDSSTVDFGNITKIKIFWGDGDSTVDPIPTQAPNGKIYNHLFAYFGMPSTKNFSVTMYSYSGTVCVSMVTKIITVHASPQIQFNSLSETCHETLAYNLNAASEVWGLPGSGYYSGAGVINQTNGTFSPNVADTGNHIITYSFITPEGCRADSSKFLRVNPTPISSFNFSEACLPNAAIQFQSTSSVPYYSINQLQHLWNFDDPNAGPGNPNTSNSLNPTHIFTTLDTFDVRLRVVSPKGCMHDTIIRLIPDVNIFPQPIAGFSLDSSRLFCEGTSTLFLNTTDSMGRNLIKWWWNFGDGSVDSINRKPSHLYTSAGNYNASLQVENAKGCVSTISTKQITIESIPVADFLFDTTCYGKPIQFRDNSTNNFGAITGWQWNFGDGNSSTQQNPQHTYFNYGNYSVRLQVITFNGCNSVSTNKFIPIKRVAIFAGNDTMVAAGQPVQLQVNGAVNYTWSPSIGLNFTNISNPIAILQKDQIYFVTGITQSGCIGYDTLKVIVFLKPDIYVPTGFTPNNDGKNDYLKPICVGIRSLEYFAVYNRWGQIVFSAKDMNGKWDGTINGLQQPTGSFVWIAKGTSFDGKLIERKGSFVLIR